MRSATKKTTATGNPIRDRLRRVGVPTTDIATISGKGPSYVATAISTGRLVGTLREVVAACCLWDDATLAAAIVKVRANAYARGRQRAHAKWCALRAQYDRRIRANKKEIAALKARELAKKGGAA